MQRIGGGPLVGSIHNLQRARYRDRKGKAELIEEWLRGPLGAQVASQVAFAFLAETPDPDGERWIFAMISPTQNFAVVEWLRQHSKRPQVAVSLWGLLLTALRPDTGEILLTRAQIAERLRIEPDNVSRIVAELASINALRREKDGRAVRYFLNPNIATHIPGPEARKAAREAAGPLLVLMQGGRVEI